MGRHVRYRIRRGFCLLNPWRTVELTAEETEQMDALDQRQRACEQELWAIQDERWCLIHQARAREAAA